MGCYPRLYKKQCKDIGYNIRIMKLTQLRNRLTQMRPFCFGRLLRVLRMILNFVFYVKKKYFTIRYDFQYYNWPSGGISRRYCKLMVCSFLKISWKKDPHLISSWEMLKNNVISSNFLMTESTVQWFCNYYKHIKIN